MNKRSMLGSLSVAALLFAAVVVVVPQAFASCPPPAPATPKGGGQVVGFFEFMDSAAQNGTEPLLPDPTRAKADVSGSGPSVGANPSVNVDPNCPDKGSASLGGPGPSGLPVNPGLAVDTGLDQCTSNTYNFTGVLLNGVTFSHDGHTFVGSLSTQVIGGQTYCDADGTGRNDNFDGDVPSSSFIGTNGVPGTYSFGTYHGWFDANAGAILTVNLTFDSITVGDPLGEATYGGVPLQLSLSVALPTGPVVCSDSSVDPSRIKVVCLKSGSFAGEFAYPFGPGGR